MPPQVSTADERLLAAYQEAALRIQRTLQELTPKNRTVILRRVDIIISELDDLAARYLQEALPLHFREGSDEAIAQLRNLQGFSDKIDETFGTIHTQALHALAGDARLKFGNALQGVRDGAKAAITSSLKQQMIGELLVSEIEGASNPAKRVQDILEQQQISAVQGRKRSYTLEEYSGLITHNLLADAHNIGAATRYTVNGVEYFRRIERPDCCDICRPLRDKVLWLGDPRLLPPTHPWCYGGVAPVIGPQTDPVMSPDDPRIPQKTRDFLLRKM